MDTDRLAESLLRALGGKDNVVSAVNCMTRLRIRVKNSAEVREEDLKAPEGVLRVTRPQEGYLEIVLGPGAARRCMEALKAMGVPTAQAAGGPEAAAVPEDAPADSRFRKRLRQLCRTFGAVFAPLIPGIVAAGLCAGFAAVIPQLVPDYESSPAWTVVYQFLTGINAAFMPCLTAWAGYRAAEQFGGTPILGGMLGMFTSLDQVNLIAKAIGWYDDARPLSAILRSGRGGVLAVLIGVYFMCRLERFIRKRLPDSLDTVLAPLLTLVLALVPYLLAVMPVVGVVGSGLCSLVERIALSPHPAVRMLAGYVGAALFLPMVAGGMHHGLIALYTVQLETVGYVTLYPALAMAGAGQVGAALALSRMLRKEGGTRLRRAVSGALPAGILGVGEPLIYGVMLPLGRPLLPACLGAGVGGAFVMLTEVASTAWGPSGLPGVFVMTAGPNGAALSMVFYLIGWGISVAAAFLLTRLLVPRDFVARAAARAG